MHRCTVYAYMFLISAPTFLFTGRLSWAIYRAVLPSCIHSRLFWSPCQDVVQLRWNPCRIETHLLGRHQEAIKLCCFREYFRASLPEVVLDSEIRISLDGWRSDWWGQGSRLYNLHHLVVSVKLLHVKRKKKEKQERCSFNPQLICGVLQGPVWAETVQRKQFPEGLS